MVGNCEHIKAGLPLQRGSNEQTNSNYEDELLREGAQRLRDQAVVIGNVTVYAMAANGASQEVQQDIREIKGGKRGAQQPLGLVVPYDEALRYADLDYITEPGLARLMHDPAENTAATGALVFWRLRANDTARESLPSPVLSADSHTVQVYSPIGHLYTSKFLNMALIEGVQFPVMTSANKSGEPEIVDTAQAKEFADEAGLFFIPNQPTADRMTKPKGSYPVLEVSPEGDRVLVAREGFLNLELIKRLLPGIHVELAEGAKTTNYPERQLQVADLPLYVQEARGADLRVALLLHFIGGKMMGVEVE